MRGSQSPFYYPQNVILYPYPVKIRTEGAVDMSDRWYACIDLKSFYASVECVDRGLDPLDTNLVVANEKSPALRIWL